MRFSRYWSALLECLARGGKKRKRDCRRYALAMVKSGRVSGSFECAPSEGFDQPDSADRMIDERLD
jgi:hypothetical protein